MPISALPTPPSRSDAPQDFSDRADALLGALPGFVTEANALQSDVNAKEASASSYATIATDKAAEAQAYSTTASTKASEAAAYAVAAAAAASNAEIAFDSFDDKYLGSKSADPTTDNDGNALLVGALYWNTTVGAVRVWNGSAWLSMAADASIVDFQQSGAGAVVRTVQDKLREWASVKDFGAVGNGTTNDAPAIALALQSSSRVVFPHSPSGYVISSAIDVTLTQDTEIDFNGQKLIFSGSGKISLRGQLVASGRSLTANVSQGATVVSINNASGIQQGDLLIVSSSITPSSDWADAKNDTVAVRSVSGSTVTLDEGLRFHYNTTDAGLDVLAYRPVRLKLNSPKIHLTAVDADAATIVGIELFGLRDIDIERPKISGVYPFTRETNFRRTGVRFYYCWDVKITNGDYEAVSYPLGAYGGSRRISETNPRARYCHHGHLDMGGWSSGYDLVGLRASDCYQALNSHAAFYGNARDCDCRRESGLWNWRFCGANLQSISVYTIVGNGAEAAQFGNTTPAPGYEYINQFADWEVDNVHIDSPLRTDQAPFGVKYARSVRYSNVVCESAFVGGVAGQVSYYINGFGNRFGATNISSPDVINATTIRYDGNPGRQLVVASASTISLPIGVATIFVTGTTSIANIPATGHAGRVVTLVFTDSLTVTDGGNLVLSGNFSTTNGDSLTIACTDGAAWYEVARSVN